MRALLVRVSSAAALALALTGCGYGSISPILPAANIRFEPSLVGTWRDPESKEHAVISAAGVNEYRVAYTEDNGTVSKFTGRFGILGTRRVLEVEPAELPRSITEPYGTLLLPLRYVIVVDSIGTTLQFRVIEPDSLRSFLEREPKAVAHVKRDDAIILTGQTDDVARFFTTFLSRPGVLGERNRWSRDVTK